MNPIQPLIASGKEAVRWALNKNPIQPLEGLQGCGGLMGIEDSTI
jgi:hypothetical protein